MSSINSTLAKLRYAYKKNPIAFVRDVLRINLSKQQMEMFVEMVKPNARVAVKSATGTGKTCTLACLILHQLLTEEEVNLLATSPSAGQLSRGLRSEIGKLHGRIKEPLIADLFELQRDKIFLKGLSDTHFCSLVTGSSENIESLAGFHAMKILILVDEASGISKKVMGVLKGNLTTTGSSMIQISNPQVPSGAFYELMMNPPSTYTTFTLTAKDSPLISRQWIDEVIEEYGKDSDFYKVRCLGEFPSSSDDIFIPRDSIDAASKRYLEYKDYHQYPLVLGVDVARFGSDKTIFILRQGPKVLDIRKFQGLDTMEVTSEILNYYNQNGRISSIFIDEVGLGAGSYDRAKQLSLPVIGINVGMKSTNSKMFYNLRAELYTELRDWLREGGDIPKDLELLDQLSSLQYGYNQRTQLQLMTKS
ncbi:MAG: phage terminase large subunit, partial [candidate division Zixibacteria bacterium]|nr:phage terminase large subunit [candidate division Zixibacteria bacterium]